MRVHEARPIAAALWGRVRAHAEKGFAALAVLACLGMCAGCSDSIDLIHSSWPESGLVGVVFEESGRIVAGSGLHPVTDMSPVLDEVADRARDADRAILLVYDEDEIALRGEPTAERLASARLREAEGVARLPAPRTSASGPAGATRIVLQADAEPYDGAVSADWVPPCNFDLLDRERVPLRMSCGGVYCDAEVVQGACELEIDPNRCAQGVIRGTVGSESGTLEMVQTTGNIEGCELTYPPRAGTLLSLDCGRNTTTCLVDLIDTETPFDPPLVVDRTQEPLLDVAPREPAVLVQWTRGYTASLAVNGSRVAVSTFDGQFDDWHCRRAGPTSRLFVLDSDTLDVVDTSTAPPCMTRVLTDPTSDGFIGLAGAPARELIRFDATGRAVERRGLPASLVEGGFVATDGLTETRRDWLDGEGPMVVFALAQPGDDPTSLLVSFDAETLELREEISRPDEPPRPERYQALTSGAKAGQYIVIDGEDDDFIVFEVGEPDARGAVPVGDFCIGQPDSSPVDLAEAELGTSVFVDRDDGEGVIGHIGSALDSVCRRMGHFDDADATSLVNFEDSFDLVLVGLRGRPDHDAFAAMFDATLPGFLPGRVELGFGEVAEMTSDGQGRVFATLPWAADVVRLERAR